MKYIKLKLNLSSIHVNFNELEGAKQVLEECKDNLMKLSKLQIIVKDINKEKVDFSLIEKKQKLMQIVFIQNLSIIAIL